PAGIVDGLGATVVLPHEREARRQERGKSEEESADRRTEGVDDEAGARGHDPAEDEPQSVLPRPGLPEAEGAEARRPGSAPVPGRGRGPPRRPGQAGSEPDGYPLALRGRYEGGGVDEQPDAPDQHGAGGDGDVGPALVEVGERERPDPHRGGRAEEARERLRL